MRAAFLIATLLFIARTLCVVVHRLRLIDRIGDAAIRDIDAGRAWRWRWEAYDSVSYSAQLWMFWRSLDSFWEWLRPDHEDGK